MEGIEKLPKWAQREVEDLERRLRSAERVRDAALLATNPDTTDTYVSAGFGNGKIGLPKGERVNFRLDRIEVQIRVEHDHHDEPYLSVMSNGGGGLVIEPQVSNVVRVKVNKR